MEPGRGRRKRPRPYRYEDPSEARSHNIYPWKPLVAGLLISCAGLRIKNARVISLVAPIWIIACVCKPTHYFFRLAISLQVSRQR